jgi:hypothetical protein
VKDVASRVLLIDVCYKFLNRAINQKRAKAKFAVSPYKKYLSKKMWNNVELHAANLILLTSKNVIQYLVIDRQMSGPQKVPLLQCTATSQWKSLESSDRGILMTQRRRCRRHGCSV